MLRSPRTPTTRTRASPSPSTELEVCELSPLSPGNAEAARATSTSSTPSSVAPLRVEDRLLTYGRLYAERMEQRRIEQEMARQHLEAEARAQAAAATRVLRPRDVNAGSGITGGDPAARAKEAAEREAKAQARREALLAAEHAEETYQPKLSAHSRKLAAARRQRCAESTGSSGPVTLLTQHTSHTQRAATQAAEERRQRSTHAPTITAVAKALPLPLSAPERLYALAKERAKEEAAAQQAAQAAAAQACSFAPRISKRAEALLAQEERTRGAGAGVYATLHAQAAARAAAMEARQQAARCADSFAPQINPTSRLIAEQLKAAGQTRHASRSRSRKRSEDAPASAPRARPASATQTRRRAGQEGLSALPVQQRMDVWAERRSARLVQMQRQITEEAESQCTFRPRTTPYRPPPVQPLPANGPMTSPGGSSCGGSDAGSVDVSGLLEEVNATLRGPAAVGTQRSATQAAPMSWDGMPQTVRYPGHSSSWASEDDQRGGGQRRPRHTDPTAFQPTDNFTMRGDSYPRRRPVKANADYRCHAQWDAGFVGMAAEEDNDEDPLSMLDGINDTDEIDEVDLISELLRTM